MAGALIFIELHFLFTIFEKRMSQNGSNLGPGRRRKIDEQKEVRR